MRKKCPDCGTISHLENDDPASSWEALLSSVGILQVKRCISCNAAVFLVLGVLSITRRRFQPVKEFVFWFMLILLVLMIGLVLVDTITE